MKYRLTMLRGCLAWIVVCWASQAYLHAQPSIPIRQDLGKLTVKSPDLVALATAYEEMKRLPKDHPHNWDAQANIHGIPSGTQVSPKFKGVWNTCEHGSWWFFPWHRAYIHYFERIVRKYSKNPNFALPYWYWDSTSGNQNSLHAVFIKTGPLYIRERGNSANSGMAFLSSARIARGKSTAMATSVFEGLQGRQGFGGPKRTTPTHRANLHGLLESNPHDYIHDSVDGYMSDVDLAAQDPLFWVHHANIDRLWVEWRAKGNSDPTDTKWLEQTFTFFDEDEKKVKIAVKDLLKMKNLNYVYDMFPDDPPVVAQTESGEMPEVNTLAQSKAQKWKLTLEPLEVTLTLGDDAKRILGKLLAPDKSKTAYARITLHDVKFEGKPDSNIDVYLNLPKDTKPHPEDPHYAGTFSFFGRMHDPKQGMTSEVAITESLIALKRRKEWSDKVLIVTLVRSQREEKERPVSLTFEKLTLDGAE